MGEKIESETQSLKRLQYLDLAKAVGMLCVLIGHSFISEKINTVIYAFHMPLFFFISGYLCKPQKVALKKINQKCGHILVPYVITTFFTIILSLIFESGIVLVKDHKTVFLPNMMKWLEAGVLGLGYRADYRGGVLPSIGPVWFLLALFWATLLLEAYKRLHCSPIITSIIVGVCSIVSFRYFFLPWSIQEGMVASVFMTLGYIYRPKENRIKNQKALRIGIYGFAILYIICCLHLDKHIDMVKCEYPFGVIDILGTTMCVITVLLISDMLSSKYYHYGALDIVGKHTMLILCIHTIEFK